MSSSSNNFGRPNSAVWSHMKKGKRKSNGHYQATCNYCKKFWENGKPQNLRQHLTNKCPSCPKTVISYFAKIIAEEEANSSSEKETSDSNKRKKQPKLDDFYKSEFLQPGYQEKINKMLLKAFIMCGISWAMIENPYFIELLKTLQPGYKQPLRKQFSTVFLENELIHVDRSVERIIERSENITLDE